MGSFGRDWAARAVRWVRSCGLAARWAATAGGLCGSRAAPLRQPPASRRSHSLRRGEALASHFGPPFMFMLCSITYLRNRQRKTCRRFSLRRAAGNDHAAGGGWPMAAVSLDLRRLDVHCVNTVEGLRRPVGGCGLSRGRTASADIPVWPRVTPSAVALVDSRNSMTDGSISRPESAPRDERRAHPRDAAHAAWRRDTAGPRPRWTRRAYAFLVWRSATSCGEMLSASSRCRLHSTPSRSSE